MGRLTLNVLLSFAQFEREVTAERIRDKIAASKKLGLWMGGLCPLGYDPHPDPKVRELVVNAAEADTVRSLFDLYDRHGKITDVERDAAGMGLHSKHHRFSTGREQGAVICPQARFIRSSRTLSTSGRSGTKRKSGRGAILRSSMMRSGPVCKRSCRRRRDGGADRDQ